MPFMKCIYICWEKRQTTLKKTGSFKFNASDKYTCIPYRNENSNEKKNKAAKELKRKGIKTE